MLRHAGEKGDGYAVATAVIVGDGVHRLVQIADEMYDEAEGVGSSLSGRVRILKDAKLRGEGGCEAAVDGRAIASEAAAARAARNVDEMPRGGIGPEATDVVRPGGGIDECIQGRLPAEAWKALTNRSGSENLKNHRTRARAEVCFGDQGRDLMALTTPGADRWSGTEGGDSD